MMDGYLLIGVTPEIEEVTEGTMSDGSECWLNQDIFEPESSRVRKGFVDFIVWILDEIAKVNGSVSGTLWEDILGADSQNC